MHYTERRGIITAMLHAFWLCPSQLKANVVSVQSVMKTRLVALSEVTLENGDVRKAKHWRKPVFVYVRANKHTCVVPR